MKAHNRRAIQNTCSLVCNETSYQIQNVINLRRFSSFQRLVTVTSMVLRFIRRCKKIHFKNQSAEKSDVEAAELFWFKQIQFDLQLHPSFESWKNQFRLYWVKDGFIRCKGRISKANILDKTKHPILLNAKSRLTVKESHDRVYHNGVKETLTVLRAGIS